MRLGGGTISRLLFSMVEHRSHPRDLARGSRAWLRRVGVDPHSWRVATAAPAAPMERRAVPNRTMRSGFTPRISSRRRISTPQQPRPSRRVMQRGISLRRVHHRGTAHLAFAASTQGECSFRDAVSVHGTSVLDHASTAGSCLGPELQTSSAVANTHPKGRSDSAVGGSSRPRCRPARDERPHAIRTSLRARSAVCRRRRSEFSRPTRSRSSGASFTASPRSGQNQDLRAFGCAILARGPAQRSTELPQQVMLIKPSASDTVAPSVPRRERPRTDTNSIRQAPADEPSSS